MLALEITHVSIPFAQVSSAALFTKNYKAFANICTKALVDNDQREHILAVFRCPLFFWYPVPGTTVPSIVLFMLSVI